ncbi:MAG: ribonuclease Z, partial [Chlamydiota bacterium]
DHCLGLGSMLMRLNLDKVKHPIHCYYPASGKKHFDRLRYGCVYHETVTVVEHPISQEGIVEEGETFRIEATFLEHGIDNIGWRITEKDRIKFDKEKLKKLGVEGPNVRFLKQKKAIEIEGQTIALEDVSWVKKGDVFAIVMDTRPCEKASEIAKNASVLICESTYLESEAHLACQYMHMTAKEAATLARDANVKLLIITHFSARYSDLSEFETEAKAIFPNTWVAEDCKKIPFPR